MPGIAQVWLTHKEIEELLQAVRNRGFDDLALKLQEAYAGIACEAPTAREEKS